MCGRGGEERRGERDVGGLSTNRTRRAWKNELNKEVEILF